MSFNFDYGRLDQGPPAPRIDPGLPLYAAVNGRAASLSNNECVFQSDRGGELEVMTHQVLQSLDQAREFRTLDEHVARVASVIPGLTGQGEAVRRVLGYLVQRGLLISDDDFLGSLRQGAAVDFPSLSNLVVRASDRPAQLQRLLASLHDQAAKHGRRDKLILIDDSRQSAALDEHRRLLAEHAQASGTPVHLVDASRARAIADRLAKAVPAAREILPALLQLGQGAGFGGGRGYNLGLLLTAGQPVALLDDDYIVDFRSAGHGGEGLGLDPWVPWSTRFPSGAVDDDGAAIEGDGFALQAAMVGRNLSQVLADHPGLLPSREQLRGATLSQLSHLRGDARVVSTFTGVRGASFTSDNAWLYQLDEQSRADFWRTREDYLRNVNADAVVSAYAQVVARPYGTFTPFVVDNTRLMPSTAPEGRGEDALFSVAGNFLHPGSLTLHLPITIGHLQEGRRPRLERGMQAVTPGVNRFLWEWIRNQARPARSADPADRLRFLAAQMDDLALASDEDLVGMLAEYLRYVRADLIERIQQQIVACPEAPVYWLADARAIVEANGKALLAGTAPRLDDWPPDIDPRGCAERLRSAARTQAQAWRVWPEVWQAAAELGEQLLPSR